MKKRFLIYVVLLFRITTIFADQFQEPDSSTYARFLATPTCACGIFTPWLRLNDETGSCIMIGINQGLCDEVFECNADCDRVLRYKKPLPQDSRKSIFQIVDVQLEKKLFEPNNKYKFQIIYEGSYVTLLIPEHLKSYADELQKYGKKTIIQGKYDDSKLPEKVFVVTDIMESESKSISSTSVHNKNDTKEIENHLGSQFLNAIQNVIAIP